MFEIKSHGSTSGHLILITINSKFGITDYWFSPAFSALYGDGLRPLTKNVADIESAKLICLTDYLERLNKTTSEVMTCIRDIQNSG